jgi:hypothetical protein
VLRFPESGGAIRSRAEPLRSSPVNKTYWVRWENPGSPAMAAGLTALSRRSLIEDDRVPTYALLHEAYRANLEKGLFHGCPGPSEATARIESWSYNPSL